MEHINNPEEEVVGELVEDPRPSDTPQTDNNKSPGNDEISADKPDPKEETDEIPSFLSPTDKEEMDKLKQRNPQLALTLETVYKNMQAGFTKAMQKIPKNLRNPEALSALQQKAQQFDAVLQNPQIVQFINNLGKAQVKDNAAAKKGEEPDKIAELLKNASPEQKQFYEWFKPILDAQIGTVIKPIESEVNTTKEAAAKQDLKERYPDIILDGSDGFWEDTKRIKSQHPSLSWDEALWLAVKEEAPEYFKTQGKETATSKPKPKVAPVLGGKEETEPKVGYTVEEIEKMSAKEMQEKLKLPRKIN
ncbi:MAG: hypothetical protein QME51_04175 [Planctomycetota bacterium]|nr:hypothetical protein [Planctomycetota bacterium]